MRTAFALFLMALSCAAQPWTMNDPAWLGQQQAAPAAGGCTTVKDTTLALATSDYEPFGYDSSRTKVAFNFVAGSSYTACAIDVSGYTAGSPNFGIKMSIYSDASGVPGALIGSSSGGVSTTTMPTTEGTVSFTGMSASLTSGTTYWAVMEWDGTGTFPLNFSQAFRWTYYGAGASSIGARYDGATWTAVGNNRVGKLATKSS